MIRPDVRYPRDALRFSDEDLVHEVFQFAEGILLHQALPNRILSAVCLRLHKMLEKMP